jgi:ABC-type transport system involved in multi-copper enzyme maturation permease subunit
MAIYDQSYAPWTGTYSSRATRIRAIIEMELAQPFKNIWVLLIVLLAFSLVMGWLLILFLAGSYQTLPGFAVGNRIYRDGFFNFPPGTNVTLFSMILMVLSATVGASLIARDARHRALLMYFSRSISRADYLVGKFLSLVLFLLFVTLGPGLILFFGQLGMSQERLTFGQRLGDLGALTLHSLILTVPVSAIVLAFSSLTKRAYLAAIGWSMFHLGSVTLSSTLSFALKAEWPKMLSWTNLTSHLANFCYAARTPSQPVLECGWGPPLVILSSLTVLSLALVWRRLRSVEGEE